MLPRHTLHRLIGLLAAVALLAALPAAASALPRLDTKPDPAAPAGKSPKVIFTLSGITKGKRYRVSAKQVSGQNPLTEEGYPLVCLSFIGRLDYQRAPATRFTLKPSYETYELKSNAICPGTYKGKAEMDRGNRPSKTVLTFTLSMPSMKLTHVRVPV
jgi:hypothetical protein